MLEVNPESETKLSGFTAVSGGWGGWEPGFRFHVSCFRFLGSGFRGLRARFLVSSFKFQVSGFTFQVPIHYVPLR